MSLNKFLKTVAGCITLTGFLFLTGYSQDTTTLKYEALKEKYTTAVNSKLVTFNKDVEKYTGKTLEKVIRQERLMQNKVAKIDSAKARLLFKYSIDSLTKFKTIIKNKSSRITRFFSGSYFPYLDTVKQSLGFLKKAKNTLDSAGNMQARLNASLNTSLSSVEQMESKLATVDQINEYLKQRQAVLQSQLNSFPGIGNNLKNINQEAMYYQAQIKEYKNTLSDPDKIEKLALNTLEKLPAFQKYAQQNSQLSGLFASPSNISSSPGAFGSIGATPVINGLPSRAALQQFVHQQMPSSDLDPSQMIQQQVEANGGGGGVPGIDDLKNKLNGSGQAGNAIMPDFTPNSQATKPFGKRLEYGASMQFGSSTNYLPANSNFGMQIGYKLNAKSSFGMGASYTMGLGTGWNHIRLSNQALGFRTYVKWKPKKVFFLQGGSEWNYMTGFSGIAQLRDRSAWEASALLGIGKEYKINKKLNGSILLLYDFLYNKHIPVTQPFLFRFGYNF